MNTLIDTPRNRRKPVLLAQVHPGWRAEARALHASVGLVLVSVSIAACLYWLLGLRRGGLPA